VRAVSLCFVALGILGLLGASCGGKTVSVIDSVEGAPDGGTYPGETGPCAQPEDCPGHTICHPDGVCHPRPTSCLADACHTDASGECRCGWACSDNHKYASQCRLTFTGLVTCNCSVDGVDFPWTCVVDDPTTEVCAMGEACCGYPPGFLNP